jgi:hypothetical protein
VKPKQRGAPRFLAFADRARPIWQDDLSREPAGVDRDNGGL